MRKINKAHLSNVLFILAILGMIIFVPYLLSFIYLFSPLDYSPSTFFVDGVEYTNYSYIPIELQRWWQGLGDLLIGILATIILSLIVFGMFSLYDYIFTTTTPDK